MTTETQTRQRAVKITGARKYLLIQDLAGGDRKYGDLPDEYEVEEKTIRNIASECRYEIQQAARDQADKVIRSGLFYARKAVRLAMYEDEIKRNLDLIEKIQAESEAISASVGLPAPPDTDKIARLQTNMFKAAQSMAEETGQLASRQPEPPRSAGVKYVYD